VFEGPFSTTHRDQCTKTITSSVYISGARNRCQCRYRLRSWWHHETRLQRLPELRRFVAAGKLSQTFGLLAVPYETRAVEEEACVGADTTPAIREFPTQQAGFTEVSFCETISTMSTSFQSRETAIAKAYNGVYLPRERRTPHSSARS
jgi:hypothetical protein